MRVWWTQNRRWESSLWVLLLTLLLPQIPGGQWHSADGHVCAICIEQPSHLPHEAPAGAERRCPPNALLNEPDCHNCCTFVALWESEERRRANNALIDTPEISAASVLTLPLHYTETHTLPLPPIAFSLSSAVFPTHFVRGPPASV